MPANYAVVVTDHSGVELNQIPPLSLQLTRRISAACDGQVDVLHTRNQTGLTNSNGIKVYRNGVLVFYGQITGRSRKQHVLTLKFADPFWWLSKRTRTTTLSIATPGQTGPAIVNQLVSGENTKLEMHLRMGLQAATTVITAYTVNTGVTVDSAISDMASLSGGYGFWFKINPVDNSGAAFANLDTYVSSGTDRPGAKWEFGDGTLDNIGADWTEDEGMPVTFSRVWGPPPDGQGYTVPMSKATASGGTGTFGLIEDEHHWDLPGASATLLQQMAQSYLLSAAPLTWQVKPLPNDGTDQVWTPDPWDDFDVGDTGRLTIFDGNFSRQNKTVRVSEFTVAVDDDGLAERVTSLKLETPIATRWRSQPQPSARFADLMQTNERRLRALEHTPQ